MLWEHVNKFEINLTQKKKLFKKMNKAILTKCF